MNLELLETFHQNYPEAADGHLERIKKDDTGRDGGCATYAITLQFNRVGSLIAIGCNDGRIELWDFITRRVAKILIAHAHPVCSVSWSRDSKRLLSASTDNTASIWNIVSGECEQTFRFPCPVMKVQFHPRKHNQVLVCPLRHAPVVLSTEDGQPTVIQSDDENDLSVVASYDRRGKFIYTGSSKGKVCIYDTASFELVVYFKSSTAGNAAIKSIEFSRRGDYFLLTCADRVIRVYNCKDALNAAETDPEPIKKLKDLVTGSHWRKCCFSGDGEYICAGSVKQHSIYLWERASGTLVKILHGQKGETLLDVVWHPLRPIIISLSNSVTKEQVSIWAQTQVQNWSAFAPDFKELDENVEYEERESEFDVEDEDKTVEENKVDTEEDVEVDVATVDPVAALISSDEEQEPEDVLVYLAVAPEVDNPDELSGGEETTGQKSTPASGTRKRPDSPSSRSGGGPPAKQGKFSATSHSTNQPATSSGQTYSVNLPGMQTDELHPLIGTRRPSSKSLSSGYSGQTGNSEAASRGSGAAGGNTGAGSFGNGSTRKSGNRSRDRAKHRK